MKLYIIILLLIIIGKSNTEKINLYMIESGEHVSQDYVGKPHPLKFGTPNSYEISVLFSRTNIKIDLFNHSDSLVASQIFTSVEEGKYNVVIDFMKVMKDSSKAKGPYNVSTLYTDSSGDTLYYCKFKNWLILF